jgi:hypothetical protein
MLSEADANLLSRMKARQEARNADRERVGQWVGRTAPIVFGVETTMGLSPAYSTPGRARAALKRLTEAGYLERIATPGCIVIWQLTHKGRHE